VKLTRIAIAGLVAGATLVGSAWAGIGIGPHGTTDLPPVTLPNQTAAAVDAADATIGSPGTPPPAVGARVGAAKVSMYPRPEDYGGVWERDPAKCERMSENVLAQLAADTQGEIDHLVTAGSPWPENPNCIYMGGFGIGPANPAVEFEQDPGLWVRSVAIGDGVDTMVLTIIDAEGYLWDYKTKCDRCGSKQLGEDLGDELGIDPKNFVIAATHSHAAPDLIGGWGFVPSWYMTQVTEAIQTSVRQAVASMAPAAIEVGEVQARPENGERRDTYRSAEEQQLTWLRATKAATTNSPGGAVIATIGAYAAHPTTKGTNGGTASADWVGVFEKSLESRFGGMGFHFMTGLGNMSASGGTQMGATLAGLVPDIGRGIGLTDTNIRVEREIWKQPATNVPLTALGFPGFFDREFLAEPSTVTTGKSPDTAPCSSASAFTVELPATAVRIGSQFALTAAPGEIFSNVSNTIKEKSGVITMPLAQANDALGYMPQSFEMSPVGQQGLGFFFGGVLIVNYEDSYAVDRCLGDKVLESTISMLDGLRDKE
jgi:hypothetical protein